MTTLLVALLGATPLTAQVLRDEPFEEVQGLEIDDQRGTIIPRDIAITNATGRVTATKDWFVDEDGNTDGRPVLLVMAYYDCPLICDTMLANIQMMLNEMNWTAGDQFRVVTVSFDHTNSSADALGKQMLYRGGYDREREMSEDAWLFYTTDAASARRLSEAIGFKYRFLPDANEFTHTSALFFLTPEGELHNFMENLRFNPQQVTLALNAAAEGKTATIFERIQFGCFYLDPNRNQYLIAPMTVMKIGAGGVGIALLVTVVGMFLMYELKRRKSLAA
ncbi:MAG: SCO family protein [Planctomycetota bacterium]